MEVSVKGRSVVVALPSKDGRVSVEWMTAFINTQTLLHKYGVPLDFLCIKGCSVVHMARNSLVHEFLKTDATDLLFIDNSQLWEPKDVLRLLALTTVYDCVAAPCASNTEDPRFYIVPMLDANGNYVRDDNGIIRVWRSSVAFMMIPRKTIENMIDRYPDLYYYPENTMGAAKDEKRAALFNSELIHHRVWGEDMAFCNRLTDIGGQIWVDPYIKIKREGTTVWEHDYEKLITVDQRKAG